MSSASDSSYPEEISSDEKLLRIIRSPQFAKGAILKASAFRPQRETSRVSIVRWSYRERPDSAFKTRCKGVGASGANTYSGVAVFKRGCCDTVGLQLEDAREEFQGHAHIVYPFAISKQEPENGEAFKLQVEFAWSLLQCAEYKVDPAPESDEWTIPID